MPTIPMFRELRAYADNMCKNAGRSDRTTPSAMAISKKVGVVGSKKSVTESPADDAIVAAGHAPKQTNQQCSFSTPSAARKAFVFLSWPLRTYTQPSTQPHEIPRW